jgi:superfamily II DNA or RNA helicase
MKKSLVPSDWENLDLLLGVLRDYQINALEMLSKYLNSNSQKQSLIKMPTGTGKTLIIAFISSKYAKVRNVLIVTPSEGIREQLYYDIKGRVWDKLGIPSTEKKVSRLYLTTFSGCDSNKGNIFVGTMQALNDIRKNESAYKLLKKDIDLIIFDEGHKEPAEDWKKAIREMGKKVVLMTATPVRNDNNQFNIDKRYIYNYSYHTALKERYIRDIIFKEISAREILDFLNVVISECDKHITENPDTKIIIRFKNFEDLNYAYMKLNEEGKKVIAIHNQYKNDNTDHFEGKNKAVKSVPDVKQEKANYWLHQNKLIEGIDDSSFQIVVMYDSFSDVRSLIQQIGRVVRKNDYNSDEAAVVYYRSSTTNQEKLWHEYLLYEEKLKENINLIYFSFEEFFEKALKIHPDIIYSDKHYLKKLNHLHIDDDRTSFRKFKVPLKTNVFYSSVRTNVLIDETLKIVHEGILNSDAKIITEIKNIRSNEYVIVYSAFKNSPYLVDEFFLEVRLQIILLKFVDSYLFVFDSNNLIIASIKELYSQIPSEHLQNLFSSGNKISRVTINNGFINQNNIRRQILNADDISSIAPSVTDKYSFCTTINGVVKSTISNEFLTRYIGFSKGRISDSSRLYQLNQYFEWIDYIFNSLKAKGINSNIFSRYAPVTRKPDNLEAISILLDISEFTDLFVDKYNKKVVFEKFMYEVKGNIFKVVTDIGDLDINIKFNDRTNKYVLHQTNNFEVYFDVINLSEYFFGNSDLRKTDDIIQYLNRNQAFQIIVETKRHIYTRQNFYEVGIKSNDDRLLEILKEYSVTTGGGIVNEKGASSNVVNQKKMWDRGSLFELVASQGSSIDLTSSYGKELKDHFLGFDYLICTDLNKEIADFIALDEQKQNVYFIHCKASDKMLSASAFQDVCGQIVKNLDYVHPLSDRKPVDLNNWNGTWENEKYKVSTNRIILNKGDINSESIWAKIKTVSQKQDSNVYVWALLGNMFSLEKYLMEKNKSVGLQKAEMIQIDYLLMSTWATVQNSHAKFQIYFDKK